MRQTQVENIKTDFRNSHVEHDPVTVQIRTKTNLLTYTFTMVRIFFFINLLYYAYVPQILRSKNSADINFVSLNGDKCADVSLLFMLFTLSALMD